eukprot:Gb_13093 [translate_table: standard]
MDLGKDGNDKDGMVKGFWTGWLKDLGWDPRTTSPKNQVSYHLQTSLTICQDIIAIRLKILPYPPQGNEFKICKFIVDGRDGDVDGMISGNNLIIESMRGTYFNAGKSFLIN